MPKTSRAKVSRISRRQTGHRGCFSAGMSIRRKPHSGQTESIGASHFGQMCGVEIDFPVFPSCSLILKSHAGLEHNARGGIGRPSFGTMVGRAPCRVIYPNFVLGWDQGARRGSSYMACPVTVSREFYDASLPSLPNNRGQSSLRGARTQPIGPVLASGTERTGSLIP